MILRIKNSALFLALIFFLFPFFGCGSAVQLKNDGDTGNLIDEENGLYYVYCLGYLRAAEIVKGIYAKGDNGEKLHEIPGIDPKKWLSENIEDMGVPFLFREQGETEPSLEDFGTQKIHVTMIGEINVEIRAIGDFELIEIIVNDFTGGKGVPVPEFITDSLTLYFESEK